MPDLSHFDRLDDHVAPIAHAVYDLVAEVDPSLHRMKRWNFPGFVANSTIVTVCGQPNYVNLQFFYGAHLPNPQGLLEGTGKDLRHIKFRSMPDIAREGVREVILAAIEYDKTLRDEGLRAKADK
ncbi:DUF1801 domain-containing protein [Maritalea sp.]|uniref:DUF1801 domain-containing protein n=1 Tax=Maritalea sp. TaxID=2003361 RepID=UPI003EF62E33